VTNGTTGTQPTTTSTVYTAGTFIPVTQEETIEAIAIDTNSGTNYVQSAVASGLYYAVAPRLRRPSRPRAATVRPTHQRRLRTTLEVSLCDSKSSAKIYYTITGGALGGTAPTTGSTLYSGAPFRSTRRRPLKPSPWLTASQAGQPSVVYLPGSGRPPSPRRIQPGIQRHESSHQTMPTRTPRSTTRSATLRRRPLRPYIAALSPSPRPRGSMRSQSTLPPPATTRRAQPLRRLTPSTPATSSAQCHDRATPSAAQRWHSTPPEPRATAQGPSLLPIAAGSSTITSTR